MIKILSIKELAEWVLAKVGYEGKPMFDTVKPDRTIRKLMVTSIINNLVWILNNNLEGGISKSLKKIKNIINEK